MTRDRGFHNLLDRPRDAPWRTAIGAALFTWIFLVFLAGASDRVFVALGIPYGDQIWTYRVLVLVLPPLVGIVTKRVCDELRAAELVAAERRRAEGEARAASPRASP